MKNLAVFLLSVLGATAVLAQEEAVDDPAAVEQIRRYTVEVIVFRYTEDFGLGTEQFYPDEQPAGDDVVVDAEAAIGEIDVEPATRGINLSTYAANRGALQFRLLAEDEYTLTDVLDRFERLDAYETMMHFGWTQPTLPEDQTRPIELGIFGAVPEGLQGSFSLYLSRYLHLVADFSLAAQSGDQGDAIAEEPAPRFGDPVDRYIDPFAAALPPVYYRIREDRIVKDGDLRYFDHPKFGILASIRRVEEPEERIEPGAELLGRSRQ